MLHFISLHYVFIPLSKKLKHSQSIDYGFKSLFIILILNKKILLKKSPGFVREIFILAFLLRCLSINK